MNILSYKDDLRSVLLHSGGNPYHDPDTGRFTTPTGGSRIKKYVKSDGSLTAAGERRYEEEKRRNRLKKKDNQVKDETDLLDPVLWDIQDTERRRGVVDASSRTISALKEANRDLPRTDVYKNIDLSKMSDSELRQRLTRLQTEAAYKNALANASTIKTGRDYLNDTLKYAGSALAITSSALGIALAIKELRR